MRYKPSYRAQARAQKLEGTVLLIVAVDADGRVTSASLEQSCGHAVLDHAALDAVRSWRFDPAQ
jgi:protein TonB